MSHGTLEQLQMVAGCQSAPNKPHGLLQQMHAWESILQSFRISETLALLLPFSCRA